MPDRLFRRMGLTVVRIGLEAGPLSHPSGCALPLTGKNVVDMIVTDLAVLQRPHHQKPLDLIELGQASQSTRARPKLPPTMRSRYERSGSRHEITAGW